MRAACAEEMPSRSPARRRVTWCVLAGLVLAAPLWAEAGRGRDYGSAPVRRIVRAHDGDSFRADVEGWPAIVGVGIPVRIAGIDTPEVRDRRPEVRATALAARAFTAARLARASRVELHHIRRGKYFRLVAQVLVDGEDLGAALLAAGLAKPYAGGTRPVWP